MTIIVATAVLHNIARRNADEEPPEDPTLNLSPWDHIINEGYINNEINVQNNVNATRTQIIFKFKMIIFKFKIKQNSKGAR